MILCVGTTGSGKTLMLRALAENSTPGTAVSNPKLTQERNIKAFVLIRGLKPHYLQIVLL
jgi:hypothetical protein